MERSDSSGLETARPGVTKGLHLAPPLPHTATQEVPDTAPASPPERRPRLKLHKRLEGYITAIFKLGRTERMAKQALRSGQALEGRINDELAGLAARLEALDHRAVAAEERGHDLEQQLAVQGAAAKAGQAALARSLSDMTARLDRLMLADGGAGEGHPPAPRPAETPSREGLEAFKNQLYHRLDMRAGGTPEEPLPRLRSYLGEVKAAVGRSGRLPVLDLGAGRGDWLALLRAEGLKARGVDRDPAQVAEARERGLEVEEQEALEALAATPEASLSVVSAHHLVEYLSFDQLAWLVRDAQRVLAPGGLLLLEMPDIRNLQVAADSLQQDPRRQRPPSAALMEMLMETAGYDPVVLRPLNPHPRFDEFLGRPDMNDELTFLLFGPRDLAVLGTRPTEA